MYGALSQDAEFRKRTNIKGHTCFNVTLDGDGNTSRAPGWVNVGPDWNLNAQPEDGSSMMINQLGFRDWMLEKCHEFGVEVVHPAKVFRASLDEKPKIQSVQYTRGNATHEVACHHVVFAADAWTPSLLNDLFPASSLYLRPKTDGLSWMIFKNPDPSSQHNQITLMLAPLLDHGDFELAAREDGTIFVCGDSIDELPELDSIDELPEFTTTGVFEPVKSSIDQFKSLLCRYVKPFAEGTAELQVVHQGLSYRPTNTLSRPIIAAVPIHKLTPKVVGQKPARNSGAYVCTGHGFYGITMSFGSGKVMSALVLDLEPEIDIRVFDLPA